MAKYVIDIPTIVIPILCFGWYVLGYRLGIKIADEMKNTYTMSTT